MTSITAIMTLSLHHRCVTKVKNSCPTQISEIHFPIHSLKIKICRNITTCLYLKCALALVGCIGVSSACCSFINQI